LAKKKIYAVVDIETTGGLAKRDKIIEIAIIVTDGTQILKEFSTLVNPQRSIPNEITRITGITTSMVIDAPMFYEIAREIIEYTEDCIFVAHNVNFDYSIIKEEFASLGYTYSRKQLCTVKLTRKAFPGLRSYSLGSLIENFDISVNARHRAYDDTLATVEVLHKILQKNDSQADINLLINRGIRETKLPEGITIEGLHSLPEGIGVYYMLNEHKRIIYIGKSINIRSRMLQHFGANNRKAERMIQEVKDIDYQLTGHELLAIILESYEIKLHHPEINKAQRTAIYPYLVYYYEDVDGYTAFGIDKVSKKTESKKTILNFYASVHTAKNVLGSLRSAYQLCESRINRNSPIGQPCVYSKMGECLGACTSEEDTESYNERAQLAKDHILRLFEYDFFIIVDGRNIEEAGVILVENSFFVGYGYIDKSDTSLGIEELKECIEPFQKNIEVNSLIYNYLATKTDYKIIKI
jgi:DNA polymerase III subunit epsilon